MNSIRGITASIGNLLVTSDATKAYKVHKRLFFITFWIVSYVTIFLYNTINQFILIWLGEGQELDRLTISVLLLNLYFVLMRSSVERFKEASGTFHEDRFAPLFESAINLLFSIFLVQRIGLAGVFIGTLMSNLLVIFWIKPKIVYKYVFKVKLSNYFKMYFKYASIAILLILITSYVTSLFKTSPRIVDFIINYLLNTIIINAIYLIIFWKKEIGYLVPLDEEIPFEVKRIFYLTDVLPGTSRGNHAYHQTKQVLICLSGEVKAKCIEGETVVIYQLKDNKTGLYIEPQVWREAYGFSEDAVLLVLSLEVYDEGDYLR